MIALALAAAVATAHTTADDLSCAAVAYQTLSAQNPETRAASRASYMFFLGRLSAADPARDWPPLIAAKSATFLAVPAIGWKPTDLPCGAVIQRIVTLPKEVAP